MLHSPSWSTHSRLMYVVHTSGRSGIHFPPSLLSKVTTTNLFPDRTFCYFSAWKSADRRISNRSAAFVLRMSRLEHWEMLDRVLRKPGLKFDNLCFRISRLFSRTSIWLESITPGVCVCVCVRVPRIFCYITSITNQSFNSFMSIDGWIVSLADLTVGLLSMWLRCILFVYFLACIESTVDTDIPWWYKLFAMKLNAVCIYLCFL